jgi:RHS repeat-associated protein
MTYDAADQVTEIREIGVGGLPLAYFKLVYDGAGRITSEFTAPIPAAYTELLQNNQYDADNRLINFNGMAVIQDADGNMTSGPLNSGTAVAHVYDARNQLLSVAASGSAPALSYSYDFEGTRTAVTQGTQTIQYCVDASGQTLVRTKADGSKTYYVYGPGLLYEVDDAGNTTTYHYDSRGSTVALTSGSGTVSDRVEYSSYGSITRRTGSTDTPFLYNGRYGVMTDANGLLYMRARYYNPFLRRFLNADPSGSWGNSVQQSADALKNSIASGAPWQIAGGVNSLMILEQAFSKLPRILVI